jgi:hypothetical protein
VPSEAPREAGLIPGGKAGGAVLAAREDTETGLAPAESFETTPYKAKLGLDFVGQPYVAAGVDSRGAVLGGGIALSFSDMLGEHQLYTVFQAESVHGLTDVGLIAAYVNRVHRFNWGAQISQVPYITGGFANGVDERNGRTVFVEETLLQRQIDRNVSALGFYPLDAATRIELQSGFRNLSYKNQLTTDVFAFPSGEFLGTEEQDLAAPDSINLFQSSAALVRDTSVFGATSPVLGHRFRLEVESTVGSLDYMGALVDLRQYVQPIRPVTLAARVLHYGRYGSGAEDPRLNLLFVGYQSLVRGYDTNSFSASECGIGPGCPVYDQLLGSKVLVLNAEARFPLFALFGAKNLYGPIPLEVGGFFDAGAAWDNSSKPELLGGERQLVKSVGATARLNLFGFAILQVDYAKPLDRPGKNAFFQFNLLAGF